MDSGPLVAVLDADESHHRRCAKLLEEHPGPLLVPSLCLAEVSHLIARRAWNAEVRLLGAFALGELILEPVDPADLERIAELVAVYRDLPLGTVDAAVVALAERRDVATIATLDRRHFGVVRPRHVEIFELVP